MLADSIQSGFPDRVAIPDDLRRLCEFAEANDGDVSGCFEFEPDGRDAAMAWFGDDEQAASQFAVFGRGPDGSLYALWLYEGREVTQAPVVLLDSECDENAVVANDMRQFLQLLAIGYEEAGRYPTLEPEDPDSAAELREWLFGEFGLTAPAIGTELVESAQRLHPNLDQWIRQWQSG